MSHQYDPSLLDNVPPSIFSAATAVSNWFNSQSLDPSPRWEFLSICSRNHADRLNKLERELNAANNRIKRLEEAGDALFELCDADTHQFNIADEIPQRLQEWNKAKEANPCIKQLKTKSCIYCMKVECECSDFDVSADMGAKG